jgi:hypothetical protein
MKGNKPMSDTTAAPQRATRVRPTIFKKQKQKKASSPRVPMHEEPVHPPRVAAHAPAHERPERTRRRKLLQHDDVFWLPVEEIPPGLVYEWKRFSNMGQEDPFYIASMREQGWEPVSPSRHPNWLPPGYSLPNIIKGGLILMERPEELQNEARAEEQAMAKRQVRDAEARLGMTPKGELTRNFPGVEPKITKEYMRPVVVREDK